jgi:prepilin-type processing-associated H-X9-DG protein
VQNYSDFPTREYVTYSFQIRSNKPGEANPQGRELLAGDSNPLFEQLPNDYSKSLNIEPNIDSLTLNSLDHKNRGQNVLFYDGSAEFTKSRQIGPSADDIYTLQDTDTYKGVEVPSRETDAFLAP